MRVAIYARVSTDGQSVNAQLAELREVADRRGWEIVHEYTDKGISGAKGRDQRPALDAMLKAATRGEFDAVAAWSVDRLGRSLQHLVAGLGDLQAAGVGRWSRPFAPDMPLSVYSRTISQPRRSATSRSSASCQCALPVQEIRGI